MQGGKKVHESYGRRFTSDRSKQQKRCDSEREWEDDASDETRVFHSLRSQAQDRWEREIKRFLILLFIYLFYPRANNDGI